ncbi:hypothetical protein CC86DRAFT_89521 [Ophiobolus disseminans]|uniref:Secreted protein n=1 Tax=Ophiobolus disseminans TaxID=1469910 RepID=A0A6A7AIB0_9PLEO|nr:hypothetical protein CC86DRAFT_89521 [Ophiobolus disseminans]
MIDRHCSRVRLLIFYIIKLLLSFSKAFEAQDAQVPMADLWPVRICIFSKSNTWTQVLPAIVTSSCCQTPSKTALPRNRV